MVAKIKANPLFYWIYNLQSANNLTNMKAIILTISQPDVERSSRKKNNMFKIEMPGNFKYYKTEAAAMRSGKKIAAQLNDIAFEINEAVADLSAIYRSLFFYFEPEKDFEFAHLYAELNLWTYKMFDNYGGRNQYYFCVVANKCMEIYLTMCNKIATFASDRKLNATKKRLNLLSRRVSFLVQKMKAI